MDGRLSQELLFLLRLPISQLAVLILNSLRLLPKSELAAFDSLRSSTAGALVEFGRLAVFIRLANGETTPLLEFPGSDSILLSCDFVCMEAIPRRSCSRIC